MIYDFFFFEKNSRRRKTARTVLFLIRQRRVRGHCRSAAVKMLADEITTTYEYIMMCCVDVTEVFFHG